MENEDQVKENNLSEQINKEESQNMAGVGSPSEPIAEAHPLGEASKKWWQLMNWYLKVLKKYAVFSGRARRQEYWMFYLLNIIIAFVLGCVAGLAGSIAFMLGFVEGLEGLAGYLGIVAMLYSLAVLIPGIAVAVRRLHDTDRSGWWLLIALVPLFGVIVLLVFMVQDSKPGENQYGANPKTEKQGDLPPAVLAVLVALAALVALAVAGAAVFYFLYLGHPSRQALAKVNGQKITVEQFHKELGKLENPLQDMYREEPDKFIEEIIVKTVLLQEAEKQGLSVPPKTYKDASKDGPSPEESLIVELMKKKFFSPPTVTREEIETFYSIFKDRMGGKPLKDMAPMIEQVIREGKQREEMNQFIGDLRKNAKVEIDQDRLKKMAVKPPESNTEEDFKKAMTSGKPVLVDFGANSCIPCRQMRPILKEVSREYSEKASVLVIDVYKFKNLARQYKVQLIPTLIFFDSKGKEVFRHLGVLDKESIVAKLKETGMGT